MIVYVLMYIGTIDDDVLVQLVDSVNAMIEGMYVCMYVCMYVRTYVRTYMYIWACVCYVHCVIKKSTTPLNH